MSPPANAPLMNAMNRILRRIAALVAMLAAFAQPASATTFSTDFTDLWSNASEQGWGINLIQQGDVIFATLFVYDTDRSPRWYVASNLSATGPATGSTLAFSGNLYQTSGPWFGGPFSPGPQVTQVGAMTVTFNSASTGRLDYVVNGTIVTKEITRQTWRSNNLAGNYMGGIAAIGSSCGGGIANGPFYIVNLLTITQTNRQVNARIDFYGGTGQPTACVLTGTLIDDGRYSTISGGTWSCTVSGQTLNTGTFSLTQIDATLNGISAVFTGNDQYCVYRGRFGGLRDIL